MFRAPPKWKVFAWAAIHHDDFCDCLIFLPLSFKIWRGWKCGASVWAIETHWRKPYIFIPWRVQSAYCKAIGLIDNYDYDEIPF